MADEQLRAVAPGELFEHGDPSAVPVMLPFVKISML
jgi:hypothetical protein